MSANTRTLRDIGIVAAMLLVAWVGSTLGQTPTESELVSGTMAKIMLTAVGGDGKTLKVEIVVDGKVTDSFLVTESRELEAVKASADSAVAKATEATAAVAAARAAVTAEIATIKAEIAAIRNAVAEADANDNLDGVNARLNAISTTLENVRELVRKRK